ncbi:hypothetical protein V8C44DRAFT_344888 [Trichoderma aethiopicum]
MAGHGETCACRGLLWALGSLHCSRGGMAVAQDPFALNTGVWTWSGPPDRRLISQALGVIRGDDGLRTCLTKDYVTHG